MSIPWWRHQVETFSALLAIYAGIPLKMPRSFDVFFDLRLTGWTNNRDADYCAYYDVKLLLYSSIFTKEIDAVSYTLYPPPPPPPPPPHTHTHTHTHTRITHNTHRCSRSLRVLRPCGKICLQYCPKRPRITHETLQCEPFHATCHCRKV